MFVSLVCCGITLDAVAVSINAGKLKDNKKLIKFKQNLYHKIIYKHDIRYNN